MPATILNVDDRAINRYIRTQVLQQAGYIVLEAEGGAKALELCRSARPELVLLDINMPDMSGIEVCHRIKSECEGEEPVIVLHISATAIETDDRIRSLEGGADGYLTEPVPADLLLATVRSMLRLREAERALRDRDARLRRLVDANVVGIAIADESGVKEANDEFLRMVGASRDDLTSKRVDWQAVTPPEHLSRDLQAMEEMRARGSCTPFEKEYVQPNGTRVPILIGGATLSYEPMEWISFAVDLTKQKLVEAELQQRTGELARSNHDLQQFAYVVSHDLQSPLRTIRSMTQLLARRYEGKLDPKSQELIAFVGTAVERMSRLIHDVLEYAQITPRESTRTKTDSAQQLEWALTNLQAQIAESSASVSVEGELPHVLADVQIGRVFQNLIGNAIKYRGERPPEIRIGGYKLDDEWVFSVTDNGIGFDMTYSDRIFGVFQRLHAESHFEGTGLGLAICKKIVDGYGGRMWAVSEPGKGSTFYFTAECVSDCEESDRALGTNR